MLPAVFDETVVDRLRITQRGQRTAHGKRTTLRLGPHLGRNRCKRWRVRQVVVTDDAHHLFNQIFFDLYVETIRGWGHRDYAIGLRQRQAQTLQHFHALRLSDRHADHLGCARHAQAHRSGLGHIGLQIVNRPAGGLRRSANLHDQLGNALDVLHRQFGIHTTLEAVPRIGREVVATRTARNRLGPPERGLDVDVFRVV